MATVTSKQFTLNWRDITRGFITAIITAFLTSVYQSIESGALPTLAQLKTAGLIGLGAGVSYLLKNLLSPAKIEIVPANKEQVEAIKSGEATVEVVPK